MNTELKIINKNTPVYQEVKSLKSVAEIFESNVIVQHLINIAGSEAKLAAEMSFFKEQFATVEEAHRIPPESVYNGFVRTLNKGLSFDKSKRHVYMQKASVNLGSKDNPNWHTFLEISDSSQGMFVQAYRSGQIKAINKLIVVYSNDIWEPVQAGQCPNHKPVLVNRGEPIAVWAEFEKPDGSLIYPDVFTLDDMKGLRVRSEKRAKGKANPNYGDVNLKGMDIGFFKEKALKHMIGRTFPKFDSSTVIPEPTIKEEFKPLPEHNEPTIDRGEQDDDVPF